MEGRHIFEKVKGGLAHFPTYLLIIGYVVYWLELYIFNQRNGQTSPFAALIAGAVFLILFWKNVGLLRSALAKWRDDFIQQSPFIKFSLSAGLFLSTVILACAFYAALFPPHLVQEHDLMHYRMTVPRQHLVLGTFAHIPWSAADFFYMPIDFALAPFWFATPLPNKFPQFIIMLGLLAVTVSLVKKLGGNFWAQAAIIVCTLGSHSVGIQAGTGMMDLAGCYLLLAALHSFFQKQVFLCAVELAFYFWSKSFIPPMIILVLLFMVSVYLLLRLTGPVKIGWTVAGLGDAPIAEDGKVLRKVIVVFMILSIFIGGPFFVKSMYYTGSPAYPLFFGIMPPVDKEIAQVDRWRVIESNVHDVSQTKDAYGHGRSFSAFVKHFWLIAVPEQGVNNKYDYPVGLVYLLCLAPFLSILFEGLRHRYFALIPLFVVGFWIVWWMTSQQSRFLYIPLVLMAMVVIKEQRFQSRIFMLALLLALGLTSLSVVRAHKPDWGRSAYDVLREKDKQLLVMSKMYDGRRPIMVDDADAAFATFPVEIKNKGILVLK